MSTAEKPIPVPTDLDRPYWEGAREHKLMLQRCAACGLLSAQPRIVCPRCQGEEFAWREVSGRGKIHSYSIVCRLRRRALAMRSLTSFVTQRSSKNPPAT